MYDHFLKTRQLARGEGKIVFSVDIRCIGTSGKTARSARPNVDLLLQRNVWKRALPLAWQKLASYPGSRGGGEREPGTHRSRMRLIISNFCRFMRHRRMPTAMIRNNINKLAAKLLSFVGLY